MANKPEHIEHLNKKHPGIDSGKLLDIFEKHLLSVELGMFESNQTLTMPLGCDLNKTLLVAVLDEYLNGKVLPEKPKKVINNPETEPLKDIYKKVEKFMRLCEFNSLREFIVSYTTEEADLGEMRTVLVATKSMVGSHPIGVARQNLLELLEKRIGHEIY